MKGLSGYSYQGGLVVRKAAFRFGFGTRTLVVVGFIDASLERKIAPGWMYKTTLMLKLE